MDWWDEVVRRLEPATGDVSLTAAAVWTVLAGSLLVVGGAPGTTLTWELAPIAERPLAQHENLLAGAPARGDARA